MRDLLVSKVFPYSEGFCCVCSANFLCGFRVFGFVRCCFWFAVSCFLFMSSIYGRNSSSWDTRELCLWVLVLAIFFSTLQLSHLVLCAVLCMRRNID